MLSLNASYIQVVVHGLKKLVRGVFTKITNFRKIVTFTVLNVLALSIINCRE